MAGRARSAIAPAADPANVLKLNPPIDKSFGPYVALAYSRFYSHLTFEQALRPQALDVLLYIGREVHALSGARKPLILTSAVRDRRYQRVLMHVNANAARTYSLHTTGFAFDIARTYASDRQGRAFQRVLDRLVAANAIAYIREAGAIHIAVASDARAKLDSLASLDG